MNLKSVAMATGLVLTFAAGAWLSTIMLASPQRPNRVAVQEQERTPAPSPQTTTAQFPQVHPERLPEMAASDSILPPLPPLPPVSAGVPAAPAPVPVPVPVPVAEVPPAAPAPSVVPESPVSAAPPEPPPAEPILQAPEPPPPPLPILVEAPSEQPPVATVEAVPELPAPLAAPAPVPPLEPPHEPDIDPGIAALSALVGRAPSTPSAQPVSPAPSPQPHRAAPPEPPRSAPTPAPAAQPSGSYFTIQVGSFQDPANAASLVRSLGTKGWEAFVVDWANSTGQIWKVVRVGRYQTEAQAVSASAELTSAANLRGNVIKVR